MQSCGNTFSCANYGVPVKFIDLIMHHRTDLKTGIRNYGQSARHCWSQDPNSCANPNLLTVSGASLSMLRSNASVNRHHVRLHNTRTMHKINKLFGTGIAGYHLKPVYEHSVSNWCIPITRTLLGLYEEQLDVNVPPNVWFGLKKTRVGFGFRKDMCWTKEHVVCRCIFKVKVFYMIFF